MDPQAVREWMEFRNEAYKLAYQSALKHFDGRDYTPKEFSDYQQSYLLAYFKDPKKPVRPLNR